MADQRVPGSTNLTVGELSRAGNKKLATGLAVGGAAVIVGTALQFSGGEEAEGLALLEGWSQGTFDTLEESILKHFEKHAEGVEAKSVLQYLRKAADFSRNTRGARRIPSGADAIRYEKNGRFVIKGFDGLIRSFGKITGEFGE
jgi:hypothetical protein